MEPTDLLLQGVRYRQAQVQTNHTGVTIAHSGGIARLLFNELDDDDLLALGMNPDDEFIREKRGQAELVDALGRDVSSISTDDQKKIASALQQGGRVELSLRRRQGYYAFVEAARYSQETRTRSQNVVLERLQRPGLLHNAETTTVQRTESVSRRQALGSIAVVDMHHAIPTRGTQIFYVYPTGMHYWWRPLYTLDPWLIPSIQRRAAPAYTQWERGLWGMFHGFLAPLCLLGLGGLQWLPPVQRGAFYWLGVAAGFVGLLMVIYGLLFKARKRRR